MAGANPAHRACPGESNRCAAQRHDGLGIVAIDVRHLSPGDAQKRASNISSPYLGNSGTYLAVSGRNIGQTGV